MNQIEIGLTEKLEHEGGMIMAFMEGGRGFICYSEIPGGLRIAVHNTGGLDTYYFDLCHQSIKTMYEISSFQNSSFQNSAIKGK